MYVDEYELKHREYTNDGTGFSNCLRQIIKSVITTTGEFLQNNKTAGMHRLHGMRSDRAETILDHIPSRMSLFI
jgi:hypothetical protein